MVQALRVLEEAAVGGLAEVEQVGEVAVRSSIGERSVSGPSREDGSEDEAIGETHFRNGSESNRPCCASAVEVLSRFRANP